MSELSRFARRGTRWGSVLAFAFALASAAGAAEPTPTPGVLISEHRPLPGVLTGGMPAGAPALRRLAESGVRTLIDLRSDPEIGPETVSASEAAGIVYERVPIRGEADLDLTTARALDSLLNDRTRYPVAIVCASGNRVGALLAVRAFWLEGSNPESALALGRAAGLTRLEPSVRLLLGLPAAGGSTTTPGPSPQGNR